MIKPHNITLGKFATDPREYDPRDYAELLAKFNGSTCNCDEPLTDFQDGTGICRRCRKPEQ